MSKKILKYEDLVTIFDKYEETFARNIEDKFLIDFFNNFEATILASNFSKDELLLIQARLKKMMAMFADKKEELKRQSVELIERQNQLHKYITNSNLKK